MRRAARVLSGPTTVLSASVVAAACVLGAGLVLAGPRWAVVAGVTLAALLGALAKDTSARLALVLVPCMAFIRRVTGGPDAYVENDPLVLLVPLLLVPALAGLLVVGRDPRLAGTRALWLGFLGWSALVSLVVPGSGLAVRLFGLLSVLVPAVLGYAVFEGMHRRLPHGAVVSVVALAPVAAVYGIVQYLVNPPWDLAWLADRQEDLISVGLPEPGGYRIFGPLEAPLPYALYLGLGLVLLAAWVLWGRSGRRRGRLPLVALSTGLLLTALLLTATRSVLFGLPLVALAAVAFLPGRRRLPALVLAVLVAVGTLVVPALAADQLYSDERQVERLQVDEVGDDTSLLARLDLLDQFGDVLEAPWGTGLGTSGQATRLETGSDEADNVDNGYLALAQETGLVGVVLFVLLVVRAITWGRRLLGSPDPDRALAVGGSFLGVLYFAVLLLTGSVLSSSSAMIFWIFLGLLTREAAIGRSELLLAEPVRGVRRTDGGGRRPRVRQPVS